MVVLVFNHGDTLLTVIVIFIIWFLCNIFIKDARVPTKLACKKKKDIAQGRVKGVTIRDVLQRSAMVAI